MGKYEEALERAKAGKPLDEVFPELKESEDERIRKSIIAYLSNELHNVKQLTPRTNEFEHWIAYLEKQEHIVTEAYNKGFADGTVAKRESEELERQKEPLTPEEKMNHPLYLEGFNVGRQVGEVVKKPEKWNDADDKIQRNLMTLLSCMRGDRIAESTYKKYYPWLRDLPKRFSLQKSIEWSKEDEKMFEAFMHKLEVFDLLSNKEFRWAELRLKSLHPQSPWKPSEEQMGALSDAWLACDDKEKCELLSSLYDELKNL